MSRILNSIHFAAYKHRDQRRKDPTAAPYINHPLAVAQVIAYAVPDVDEDVLIGAVLHDTIEDTDTKAEEIEGLYGQTVTGYVLEVSDDKSLPADVRKQLQISHAKDLTYGAKLIKLGDRICNTRDLLNHVPVGWPLSRVVEYFDWSKQVVDELCGTNKVLEDLFDAIYLLRPKGVVSELKAQEAAEALRISEQLAALDALEAKRKKQLALKKALSTHGLIWLLVLFAFAEVGLSRCYATGRLSFWEIFFTFFGANFCSVFGSPIIIKAQALFAKYRG